jgi:hypothetical protein
VDLVSTQEEADTRMLLHASHADAVFEEAGQQGRILITSAVTDVLVLAIHYFSQLAHTTALWIETGVVTRVNDLRRYIHVHAICSAMAVAFCQILPAVHALTGYDSTSAMFGLGNGLSLRLLLTIRQTRSRP